MMNRYTRILMMLVLSAELWSMAADAPAKQPQASELAAGHAYLAKNQNADALRSYRNAAQTGTEGAMYVGELLLFGKKSPDAEQSVPPDPIEGVRWTFWAATNRSAQACENLAVAFELGIGVKTNLVQAYAWRRLAKELSPVFSMAGLDRLAVCLDSQQVLSAQKMAQNYHAGEWPECPVRKVIKGDPRFTLNGITSGGRTPLAVINHRTLALGEVGQIVTSKGSLMVKCVEVNATSVIIEVTHENEARELTLP